MQKIIYNDKDRISLYIYINGIGLCFDRSYDKFAHIYFNYFESNFDGKFGVANSYAYGSDTTYYNIVKKSDLNDYYNTNPSQLYKFYYVSNTNVDDNGFLLEDSVFIFEIRYEFSTTTNNYQFKMFIEKANKSNNGVFTYKYKLAQYEKQ